MSTGVLPILSSPEQTKYLFKSFCLYLRLWRNRLACCYKYSNLHKVTVFYLTCQAFISAFLLLVFKSSNYRLCDLDSFAVYKILSIFNLCGQYALEIM